MLSFKFSLWLSAILKQEFLESPGKSSSVRPPRGMKFGSDKKICQSLGASLHWGYTVEWFYLNREKDMY